MNDIPVLLLTGYLGSGKTTLLNKILSNRRGIRFAVIVNDIGEVNIDADLIQKGGVVGRDDESLMALQNGCICCTLKMDLVKQLSDIMQMQRFDYIVIEASGICEPEPIAQTIENMPRLDFRLCQWGIPRLDSIVTVVDALRMKDEFQCAESLVGRVPAEEDIENLVIQQIEFCNIILLNKASEVSADELSRIRRIISTIQPTARIIECDYCDVDFDMILNTGLFDFDKVATSATWIKKVEGALEPEDEEHEHHHEEHDEHDHEHEEHEHHHHEREHEHEEHEHEHDHDHEHEDHEHHHHDHEHHHHHHHHGEGEAEEYGIGTYVYFARKALDMNKFDNFVAKHWPKNVIRCKGLCYFSDQRDVCYLFEQAGSQMTVKDVGQWFATMPATQLAHLLEEDAVLRRDWDPVYGDRMQKLVFIGQKLDRQAIKEALDFCLE